MPLVSKRPISSGTIRHHKIKSGTKFIPSNSKIGSKTFPSLNDFSRSAPATVNTHEHKTLFDDLEPTHFPSLSHSHVISVHEKTEETKIDDPVSTIPSQDSIEYDQDNFENYEVDIITRRRSNQILILRDESSSKLVEFTMMSSEHDHDTGTRITVYEISEKFWKMNTLGLNIDATTKSGILIVAQNVHNLLDSYELPLHHLKSMAYLSKTKMLYDELSSKNHLMELSDESLRKLSEMLQKMVRVSLDKDRLRISVCLSKLTSTTI